MHAPYFVVAFGSPLTSQTAFFPIVIPKSSLGLSTAVFVSLFIFYFSGTDARLLLCLPCGSVSFSISSSFSIPLAHTSTHILGPFITLSVCSSIVLVLSHPLLTRPHPNLKRQTDRTLEAKSEIQQRSDITHSVTLFLFYFIRLSPTKGTTPSTASLATGECEDASVCKASYIFICISSFFMPRTDAGSIGCATRARRGC